MATPPKDGDPRAPPEEAPPRDLTKPTEGAAAAAPAEGEATSMDTDNNLTEIGGPRHAVRRLNSGSMAMVSSTAIESGAAAVSSTPKSTKIAWQSAKTRIDKQRREATLLSWHKFTQMVVSAAGSFNAGSFQIPQHAVLLANDVARRELQNAGDTNRSSDSAPDIVLGSNGLSSTASRSRLRSHVVMNHAIDPPEAAEHRFAADDPPSKRSLRQSGFVSFHHQTTKDPQQGQYLHVDPQGHKQAKRHLKRVKERAQPGAIWDRNDFESLLHYRDYLMGPHRARMMALTAGRERGGECFGLLRPHRGDEAEDDKRSPLMMLQPPIKVRPFAKMAGSSNYCGERLRQIITTEWGLDIPRVALCVIGDRQRKLSLSTAEQLAMKKSFEAAASSDSIWFLTTGWECGISGFVGECVTESPNPAAVIGISSWEAMDSEALEYCRGGLRSVRVAPQETYRGTAKLGVVRQNAGSDDMRSLAEHHTHHVFVEGGNGDCKGQCRAERDAVASLVNSLRHADVFSRGTFGIKSDVNCMALVVAGDTDALDCALHYVQNRIPLVVVDGCPGASAVIAKRYRLEVAKASSTADVNAHKEGFFSMSGCESGDDSTHAKGVASTPEDVRRRNAAVIAELEFAYESAKADAFMDEPTVALGRGRVGQSTASLAHVIAQAENVLTKIMVKVMEIEKEHRCPAIFIGEIGAEGNSPEVALLRAIRAHRIKNRSSSPPPDKDTALIQERATRALQLETVIQWKLAATPEEQAVAFSRFSFLPTLLNDDVGYALDPVLEQQLLMLKHVLMDYDQEGSRLARMVLDNITDDTLRICLTYMVTPPTRPDFQLARLQMDNDTRFSELRRTLRDERRQREVFNRTSIAVMRRVVRKVRPVDPAESDALPPVFERQFDSFDESDYHIPVHLTSDKLDAISACLTEAWLVKLKQEHRLAESYPLLFEDPEMKYGMKMNFREKDPQMMYGMTKKERKDFLRKHSRKFKNLSQMIVKFMLANGYLICTRPKDCDPRAWRQVAIVNTEVGHTDRPPAEHVSFYTAGLIVSWLTQIKKEAGTCEYHGCNVEVDVASKWCVNHTCPGCPFSRWKSAEEIRCTRCEVNHDLQKKAFDILCTNVAVHRTRLWRDRTEHRLRSRLWIELVIRDTMVTVDRLRDVARSLLESSTNGSKEHFIIHIAEASAQTTADTRGAEDKVFVIFPLLPGLNLHAHNEMNEMHHEVVHELVRKLNDSLEVSGPFTKARILETKAVAELCYCELDNHKDAIENFYRWYAGELLRQLLSPRTPTHLGNHLNGGDFHFCIYRTTVFEDMFAFGGDNAIGKRHLAHVGILFPDGLFSAAYISHKVNKWLGVNEKEHRDVIKRHMIVDPYFSLYIWALITNRHGIAITILAKRPGEVVINALVGAQICARIIYYIRHNSSDINIPPEVVGNYVSLKARLLKIAQAVLTKAAQIDSETTVHALQSQWANAGGREMWELAYEVRAGEIAAMPVMRDVVEAEWWENVDHTNSFLKILCGILTGGLYAMWYTRYDSDAIHGRSGRFRNAYFFPMRISAVFGHSGDIEPNDYLVAGSGTNQASFEPNDYSRRRAFRRLFHFFHSPQIIFYVEWMWYNIYLLIYSFASLIQPKSWGEVFEFNDYFNDSIEVLSLIFVLTHVIEEVHEAYADQWWASNWNKWDFVMYAIIILGMAFKFLSQQWALQTAKLIGGIGALLLWLRSMRFFAKFPVLGPKTLMIYHMLNDFMVFGALVMVGLVGSGVAMYSVVQPWRGIDEGTVVDVFYRPAFGVFGELFLEETHEDSGCTSADGPHWRSCLFNWYFAMILLVLYMLYSNVLLVNLLIAMMNATYEDVEDNSNEFWSLQNINLLREMKKDDFPHPPPFNILFYAGTFLLNLSQHLWRMCTRVDQKDHAPGIQNPRNRDNRVHPGQVEDKDEEQMPTEQALNDLPNDGTRGMRDIRDTLKPRRRNIKGNNELIVFLEPYGAATMADLAGDSSGAADDNNDESGL
mmetsp:Transcript_24105/g.71908  ORF Transcript_24105/g.71908 Transcript_24105/m.71908 type:complete len:1996 (-) Transcript_24105:489-6476(-)